MITSLDHLVLTTRDISGCVTFYTTVLGMREVSFGSNRTAFMFGEQKINVHVYGYELEPKAHLPVPGSLDLCFIIDKTIPELIAHLKKHGVRVIEGPVKRTGAQGDIESVYLRDPDLNLIELASYGA